MPSSAFATVTLHATPAGAGVFHVKLAVTSHTHQNPDLERRSSVISGVYLTELDPGQHTVSNQHITDKYGVDQTALWRQSSGVNEGFKGYTEWDNGHGVQWLSNTGIYDAASLHDTAVDARRLQTYTPNGTQLAAFNYLTGPLTFEFDITLAAKPKAVLLNFGLVGGNGGNVASHNPAFPDESVVIHV